MGGDGVDLPLMAAWLAARSLSRGLPSPVADHGGVRVDTGAPDEARRYVFAEPCDGLKELGRTITAPFVPLKLCRPAEDLLALLPERWAISSTSWVMAREQGATGHPSLPPGYNLTLSGTGPVWRATVTDAADALAASGYAAEADGVFIYDRIRTEPPHERRGLGRVLMAALGSCRNPACREVLTATAAGRALYLQLGWRDLAPYSTASIPAAS